MAPFKFPPPPPPPPKAAANDTQDQYSSQRGGVNNSRGGRGRGGQSGGRGNSFRGNNRGGYGRGNGRGQGNFQHQRGGTRGGNGGNSGPQYQQNSQSQGHNQQQQYPAQQMSPPPNFQPSSNQQQQLGQQPQPTVDPAAFAQAMALISTRAGMLNFTAFANQMSNGSPAPPPQPLEQSSPPQGQKRKRSDHGPPTSPSQTKPKPKPQRAKVAVPPAVPSFGFSIPTLTPASAPQHSSKGTAPVTDEGKKRKLNLNLGLTQGHGEDVGHSSEDEGLGDEEAAFAANPEFQGMTFEHNGVSISLQTPADIAAWIQDRRKEYPTRKRAAEKAKEAAERRAGELEFLRRVKGKKPKREPQADTAKMPPIIKKEPGLDDLRNKVKESILAKRRLSEASDSKPPTEKSQKIDLGLGYDSGSDSSSILSESSVVSSSSDESDDGDSDSDSVPEAASSKVAPPTLFAPPPQPPPKVPPVAEKPKPKNAVDLICEYWRANGTCRFGDNCRFLHPIELPLGLYERLVEQEKEKADRLALDAIKWLGQNGFLG